MPDNPIDRWFDGLGDKPEARDDSGRVRTRTPWDYRREALIVLAVTAVALTAIALPPLFAAEAVTLWLCRKRIWHWQRDGHVRRQWIHAVLSAGASDPPPLRSRRKDKRPKVKRVEATAVGDVLTVKVGHGRGTIESLTKHRAQLAANLDGRKPVREVRVEATDKASEARVTVIRRDPFKNRQPVPWPHQAASQLSMWDPIPLGVDENGTTIPVSLVEKNLLIGGEPGAGKSAVLSLIAATAAMDDNTRLYLLDGKTVELAAWEPSAEALIGPSITEANVLLNHLRNVMEARYQDLRAQGLRKVNHGALLHVLICDELALYLQDADKKARGLFAEQLRDLIARGRAAGVIVIAATQKPSVDTIPSFIRDLMQLRLALRCTTPQASDTILGQGQATTGADASTVAIGQRGVGYLLSEGEHPIRLKAFYLNDGDITDIASRVHASQAEDELQAMLAAATPDLETARRHGASSAGEVQRPAAQPPSAPPRDPRQQGLTPEDLANCLPSEGDGLTRDEWTAAAGRRKWDSLARPAATLLEQGVVVQTGAGQNGDPFRYRLAVRNGEPFVNAEEPSQPT